MSEHRVRLTDDDEALIVAALSARMAMLSGVKRAQAQRLIERFLDSRAGNPEMKYRGKATRDNLPE